MKIIVDSSCDISEQTRKEYDIHVEYVPFNLQLDEKSYVDDDSFQQDAYIDEMRNSKVVKTAAPSPELFLDHLKGEEEAFIITISAPLSASYNNALLAKQTYIEEYGEKFIHVIDSHSASTGPALIALKINELAKKGLPIQEIADQVDAFEKNLKTYFVLERYDNLVKNGRINAYVAKVASMLSIKPVCAEKEGQLAMLDKARGTTKALNKVIDYMLKDKPDYENRTLAIGHVRCPDKALWFRDEVLKKIPFKDVIISGTKGLCTTYADDEGLIISF